MSTVRELHNQAMHYAHLALVAREQGRSDEAVDYARQAYQYEHEAIHTLVDGPRIEPTRSILYQSAASLAYQSHMFAEAERLIIMGLHGTPPSYVREQLYNLLTSVRFQQRLKQEGFMSKEPEAFNISLFGNAVGFGTIWYDEFQTRITSALEIIERNIQRHSQKLYQRGGAIAPENRPFVPVLQPIQEGNVIVTIQLIQSDNVAKPMFTSPEQAISDLIIGMKYLNESNMKALEELISDESYRRNFVANAKRIAPDGDKITLVGLSHEDSTVSFTRQSQEIPLDSTKPSVEETSKFQAVEITGVLDVASRKKSTIILTDDAGKEHSIQIGEGLDTYVRSFLGYRVTIIGTSDGKNIRLHDLQEAKE